MFRKIKLKIIPIFLIYQNVFIGPEFLWMTRAHGNIYYKQKAGEFSTINFPSKPLKPQRQLTVWELWSVGICGRARGVDCACGGHSRRKQCIKRRPMFRKEQCKYSLTTRGSSHVKENDMLQEVRLKVWQHSFRCWFSWRHRRETWQGRRDSKHFTDFENAIWRRKPAEALQLLSDQAAIGNYGFNYQPCAVPTLVLTQWQASIA